MTRKEELEERAEDLASGPVSPYEVYAALAKVEREVWERATIGYAQWINGEDKEDYPRFEDWLIAQQQELA